MKKTLTILGLAFLSSSAFAQWSPAKYNSKEFGTSAKMIRGYYKLDLASIREQLKNAPEMGSGAQPVIIALPTLDGKIERFNVYSLPVVVKSLADRYDLGSYTGAGVDDPSKLVRFSVAPNDFQSMLYHNGAYEFIEPVDKAQGIYGVHPKTTNTGTKPFTCATEEGAAAQKQIADLAKNNSFANNAADFSKNADQKYRTMRLAMSVTGEYTQAFGGTVALALAQINATLTRVNGVFEKDFALHLNLQDYPGLIYVDPATDPYSTVTGGNAPGAWGLELQQTLTAIVGNDNYDIGHLFGASGGGGNAGCIGCVCVNPATANTKAKGSAYTSPAGGLPQGDNFDIDYVAHEFGHQLGANHTFSHSLESANVNVEPGSGSSIMGYAGITGANSDVQPHSDAYFHAASIQQVQANLIAKTCDVETPVTNTPPTVAAMPNYTIPKSTAFVLTGSATDAEGDPLTYTWEQMNNATVAINKSNLGNTTTGATFRSKAPSASPVRYFPALATVLNGVLRDTAGWESVSSVARTTNFRLTARDNNADPAQQQTNFANQVIVVGADGPFKITTDYMNAGVASPFTWDVANTAAAPYSAANVKIDYTVNNGTSWTVLSASTPNDGAESLVFPAALIGQPVKVRVSAIGNVFYAAKSVTVATFGNCDGSAPAGLAASGITPSAATLSWNPVTNATYIVHYRKVGSVTWTTVTTANPSVTITGLADNTQYEAQVAAVCDTTPGAYSSSVLFTTLVVPPYCTSASTNSNYEYISNVTLANINNTSGNSTYTNYTANAALQINLQKGNSYTLSVTKSWMNNEPDFDAVSAWIDFNHDGVFDENERILTGPVTDTTVPVTVTFTVPATAVENVPLRMRVINVYAGEDYAGYIWTTPCGSYGYGETEDYNVVVTSLLATAETANSGIEIYPNPATDFIRVTKLSNRADYKIYSVAGQLVAAGKLNNGQIAVSSLVKGNYVLSVTDGTLSATHKFIKK